MESLLLLTMLRTMVLPLPCSAHLMKQLVVPELAYRIFALQCLAAAAAAAVW